MKKILLLPLCLLLSLKGVSQTSLTIIQWYNDSALNANNCAWSAIPPYTAYNQVLVDADGYDLMNDTFLIQCRFGDGFVQTIASCASNGGLFQLPNSFDYFVAGYFYHTYFFSGTYDVTYIVTAPDGKMDSLFCAAENIFGGPCGTFTVYGYLDNNANCMYDTGEQLVYNIPLVLLNGSSFYSQFSNGANNASINAGINYTAQIDTAYLHSLGYAITCGSGLINFTATTGNNTIYFGVGCPSIFDVGVYSSGYGFKLGNTATVLSGLKVKTCSPTSGNYNLTLDPKLSFLTSIVPPVSGSGLNYTWNYSNMQSFNNSVAYNALYFNLSPTAQIGDTLCYTFALPPSFTDDDPTNNSVTVCYPVKAAWDPNMKEVSPAGIGAAGLVAPGTQLTYSLFFQNTGNDTAKHVYLLDTIDSDLDINSLEVLQSSHSMQLYILNGNVLKFDFRNINLPDSNVNEVASHGYVLYRIKPKNNLTNGTTITNSAAIYFDSNPAIITNTTLNTISIPLSISESNFSNLNIYPNPASDKLIIETSFSGNANVKISDLSGKEIVSSHLTGRVSEINTSNLKSGIYFLQFKYELSILTKKIIIE